MENNEVATNEIKNEKRYKNSKTFEIKIVLVSYGIGIENTKSVNP